VNGTRLESPVIMRVPEGRFLGLGVLLIGLRGGLR
jgi:hypothetical protein